MKGKNMRIVPCFIMIAVLLSAGLWGCASRNAPMGSLTREEYQKLGRKNMVNTIPEPGDIKLPQMSDDEHERLGDHYFIQNNLEMAYLHYGKALRHNPDNTRIIYKRGLVFLAGGMNKDAVNEFRQVLKRKPDLYHTLAHEGMGQAFFKMGQFDEAEIHFQEVLKIYPGRWKAYNFLGIISNYQGQYDKAVDFYSTALELRPGEASLNNNLGVSRSLMGEYGRAVQAFREALRTSSSNKIYNNLGMALCKLGRYEEALEAFRKGGDEAQAYNNMGSMYLQKGEYQKAILAFQKAVDSRPTYYENAAENLKKAKEAYLQQSSSASGTPFSR